MAAPGVVYSSVRMTLWRSWKPNRK